MPFDFSNLRLPPTFELGAVAKKLITTIPVKKPSSTEFFRIRPEDEWTFQTFLLDLNEGEEGKYLVIPELVTEVSSTGRLRPVTIYTGITHPGQVLFLSDIPLPNPDGRDNRYNISRRVAYDLAKTKWVRIQSNTALGAYQTSVACGILPDPVWPEEPESIINALEIAFKDKLIDSHDHPVLKRLRGEP